MRQPPSNRQRPRITLSRDGPLLVAVDDLTNSKGERLEAWYGVALCRCGASVKKPFCDGSHISVGFSDDRGADRAPDGVADHGGGAVADDVHAPSIRIARNGPYEVRGIDLDAPAWIEAGSPKRYTLCRCGGSKNKPFCDGTHRRINFVDDKN